MTNLEKWTFYYNNGATKEQLKRVVQLGGLTPAEYKLITGDDYVA